MFKAVAKGISIILFLAGGWFVLSQMDYMAYFDIKGKTDSLEEELGKLIRNEILKADNLIENESLMDQLNVLIGSICEANKIDREDFDVHIIKNNDVNAFAMPGNQVVIYTGLIESCANAEALCGVIGHEMAHLKKGHVMKKLSKEIGLTLLVGMTTGRGGNGTVGEVMRTLSSTAYDRAMEREADQISVEYLLKAKIDPRPFADFLYTLSFGNELHESIYWITTHPDSKSRAKAILEYTKDIEGHFEVLMTKEEWAAFQLAAGK